MDPRALDDAGGSVMATRRRIVVGSLAGAVAIHLVMLSCSANAPSVMGLVDGGGIDAAGSDVAAADVARLDTGSTTTDTGNHDAGFLDTLLDAVRDVIGEVADAEVRDAHAGGDGGVADGGATACACPPPPPTYSFSGRATGLPIFGPSSTAHVDVRALPPGYAPFGTVEPAVRIGLEFTAWVSRSRGPAPATVYLNVRCTGLMVDGAGRVIDTGAMNCRMHDADDPSTSGDNVASTVATLAMFSATQVEVRIASLTFSSSTGASLVGPAFTDLVFRATDPNGHFTAPTGAYVP
jgi:hypothetical protein